MNKLRLKFAPLLTLVKSKTAVNTYFVIGGNFLSAVLAFVFTYIATKALTKADFGYFSAMLSLSLLVSDLSDFGIGSSLSAFLPALESQKDKLLQFLKSSFIVQSLIIIAMGVLLFFISGILAQTILHDIGKIEFIYITIIFAIINIFSNYFQYALSARQKFYSVAFLSSYSSAIRVFLLGILIVFSLTSVSGVLWLHVVTFFLTGMTAIYLLKGDFIFYRQSFSDAKKLIGFSYHLGIARGLTALASRLDVLMLMALLSPAVGPLETADYAVASKVVSIYPLFAGSFSTVIAPKLSVITDRKELKSFMMKISFGTLGLIGTIVVMILLADPFMNLLFTKAAVEPFQLLLISMIFFVASIPVVSLVIYYLKKPKILSVNSVLQVVIVIAGNYILIPQYGKLGPAISLILSYGITLFTTAFYAFIELKRKHA